MAEPIRVLIQMKSTLSLVTASFGPLSAAPMAGLSGVPGVRFDASYPPVPIPAAPAPGERFAAAASVVAAPTFVVRAVVPSERWHDFIDEASQDQRVVGVFGDPRIQPIGRARAAAPGGAPVCPSGPVGTEEDVAELLGVRELHARGMDGTGVRVVIVDTGIRLSYLQERGRRPAFDSELSWGPRENQPLGNMPLGHGTMCAYDVGIAAPRCTLIDHALLTSTASGQSVMDGFLSDAVWSYANLRSYMTQAPGPFAGDHRPRSLVVNNSWGMFHPSWDFPVGTPQNYSHNPAHPFNLIVASLEEDGADILFAAGNCGTECPDGRCEGVTDAGIFGANSHPAVLCVAGVKIDRERVGYSTKGPGRLEGKYFDEKGHPIEFKKPDIACYTHFAGSGVYTADGGTSAATPVAAGVVAAFRRRYPASLVPSARLRELIRQTAESPGTSGFNYEYGYGILNAHALIEALEREFGPMAGSRGGAPPPPPKKTRTRAKPQKAK